MARKLTLQWSLEALADLHRFAIFLRADHPGLSQTIGAELIRKASILEHFPKLGWADADDPEFREIVFRALKADYVLQYRYDGRRLTMLRIFHGRENRNVADPQA